MLFSCSRHSVYNQRSKTRNITFSDRNPSVTKKPVFSMKKSKVPVVVLFLTLCIVVSSSAQETYGPIKRGDNLWDIARGVYHDQDVSRDQVILALLKANPQAFSLPCNANSTLQIGQVLRIPSLEEVKALSQSEAQRLFAQQIREWEQHRRTGEKLVCPKVSKPAATPTTTPATPPTEAQPSAPPSPAPTTPPATQPAPSSAPITPASPAPTAKIQPPATAPTPPPAVETQAPAANIQPSVTPATPPPAAKTQPPAEPSQSSAGLLQDAQQQIAEKTQEAEETVKEEPVWVGILVLILLLIGIALWKFRRREAAVTEAPASVAAVAEGAVDFAKLSTQEALNTLKTDTSQGLTAAEAEHRLSEVGPNALEEKKVSLLKQIMPYFWGPIPWMIEAAALLSLVTEDWNDFIIITVMLLLNAFIGFREEHSAANALAALKGQLALQARARRDGRWQEVAARELVPGDILRIRPGDIIPADAKLLSGDYLSVDQAALTGESLPVHKRAGDLAYSGSVAKQGEMLALVTGTGANTFFGRTAQLVESAGAKSHLQESVLQVGNFLILSAIALCVILTAVELYWGTSFLSLLKLVLILVVASIPVAMPAVLSVTMALGALTLSKMKAIVSRLEAIEEMAGVDILCSDKTGTLTQNKITLGKVEPFGGNSEQELILAGALASKAENNDAIDLAVIGGLDDPASLQQYEQSQFMPFDPVGKRTEATVKDANGSTFKVTKGAPQVILQLCQVDPDTKARAEALIDDFAAKGLRALGVSRTGTTGAWQFLGILPLFDPPREDSAATIAATNRYGIQVKMVTGDNTAIAREIAGQLGIGTNIQSAEKLFAQGASVSDLSAAATRQIEAADGFAQVFPEHKYGIVKALQNRGHIVAMTGDGVNDAPALKQADVGIAVSGATDAARTAAALVLTKPGLAVITTAVEEARCIFERMMSYIIYRIAMSVDIMVFVVLASIIFGFFPLTAIMLVALALLDDIPIMAIAYDNTEPDPQPARWNKDRVFTTSLTLGFLAVVQSFALLYYGMKYLHLDAAHLQTMLFLQLVVGGHLMLFLTRTKKAFWRKPYPSWQLFWALLGTQIFVVFMTGLGWLVPALPWYLIGIVWAYNLVWMIIQDLIKLGIYRFLAKREPSRDIFSSRAQTFVGKTRESAHSTAG